MVSHAEPELANALKILVKQLPLDKITIDSLADLAHVNRNTFYYHFDDIYDLLKWTLEHDIIMQLQCDLTAQNWSEKYEIALSYVAANKQLCLEALHSQKHDLLEKFLFELGSQMVQSVMLTIDNAKSSPIAEDLIDFYGSAIAAQIIKWLITDCKTPQERLVTRAHLILNGAIEFITSKHIAE
ncbi:MAG: TetR/AcrR family transcriptional regulator C-terminal domain-containing protein [Leuconostoc mesenteroides]